MLFRFCKTLFSSITIKVYNIKILTSRYKTRLFYIFSFVMFNFEHITYYFHFNLQIFITKINFKNYLLFFNLLQK